MRLLKEEHQRRINEVKTFFLIDLNNDTLLKVANIYWVIITRTSEMNDRKVTIDRKEELENWHKVPILYMR